MADVKTELSTHLYPQESVCVQVGSCFFSMEDKSTQTLSEQELSQLSWKPIQQTFQGFGDLTFPVVGKNNENNLFVDWIAANQEITGLLQSTLQTKIDHDLGVSDDHDMESNKELTSDQSSKYSRRKGRPTRIKDASDFYSNLGESSDISSDKVMMGKKGSTINGSTQLVDSIPSETDICPVCNKAFEGDPQRHVMAEHYSLNKEDIKTEADNSQNDELDGKNDVDKDERQNAVIAMKDRRHFNCKKCALDFSSSHKLRVHNFTHRLNPNESINDQIKKQKCTQKRNKDKKFKCSYCNKCFVYHKMLKNHRQYKCKNKQENSKTGGSLTEVNDDRNKEKSGGSLTELNDDRNEMKTGGSLTEVKDDRNEMKSGGSLTEVNTEIDEAKLETSYNCSKCGEVFSSLSNYSKHIADHTDSFMTQCQVCNIVCNDEQSLQSHIQEEHSKSGLFVCRYCDKICCSFNILVSHTHNKHNIGSKAFQCETCGKSFSLLNQLRNHSKIHTGNKPFHCEFCSYQTKEGHSLKVHMRRKHTGERPYVCETCGKSFCGSNTLRRHIRTHTGEKPYKCHICGDQFAAHWTLSIHIRRKHTTERPHQCDVCGTAFAYKSDLTKHKLIHENVKPFSCEICSAGFTTKSKKRKHIKTAHLMEESELPLLS